jgi:hypothetical protein
MAGKIIADQIEHSTAGSLDTQYVVNGSAKAHASLDGATTPSLFGSFNISGITDSAVGDTLYNFSSAMNDAVYSIAGSSNSSGATVVHISNSTTQFRTLQRLDSDGSTASDTDNSSAIFGDLA